MTEPEHDPVLRPATDDDLPFLRRLYASTRTEELAQVDWAEAQKAAFLHMQFEAQHRHYQEHYPRARFDVVLMGGVPAGRLYVDVWTDQIRLVDVALLPEHRGRGLGTRLIRSVLDEGAAAGRPVTIHVEQFNPALRLYERLGFRRIGEHSVYHLLEWRPDAAGTGGSQSS